MRRLWSMKSAHIRDIQRPAAQGVFATQLLEGDKSNVRVIRIAPGQALPPHRHGASDLMLFAAEGDGVLELSEGSVQFGAGALAFYRGDEELRVRNTGSAELTLLAFLAPKFPPAPAPPA
jgi:mannose-6-phosphate isomerase-like protein (cupin superfamily)